MSLSLNQWNRFLHIPFHQQQQQQPLLRLSLLTYLHQCKQLHPPHHQFSLFLAPQRHRLNTNPLMHNQPHHQYHLLLQQLLSLRPFQLQLSKHSLTLHHLHSNLLKQWSRQQHQLQQRRKNKPHST
jgi:hypothetical protein